MKCWSTWGILRLRLFSTAAVKCKPLLPFNPVFISWTPCFASIFIILSNAFSTFRIVYFPISDPVYLCLAHSDSIVTVLNFVCCLSDIVRRSVSRPAYASSQIVVRQGCKMSPWLQKAGIWTIHIDGEGNRNRIGRMTIIDCGRMDAW